MARKLDAARIERARRKEKRENTKEIERQRMHETMEENRKGSRKGRMRMPEGAKARELEKPKKVGRPRPSALPMRPCGYRVQR